MARVPVLRLLSAAWILAAGLVAKAAPGAAVTYIPKVSESFVPENCEKDRLCSLREFRVEVTDIRRRNETGYSLRSQMVARYRTDSVGSLRDYAVVQFIRGCVFESYKDADGKIVRSFSVGREFFGNPSYLFRHPEWVIDSEDEDPVYWSVNGISSDRHYQYAWNRRKGSTESRTAVYFGERAPAVPELYVRDLPTGATVSDSYGKRWTTNLSLQFQTCLYRTSDVPLRSAPDGMSPAGAIHCVKWASSYVYDHEAGRFDSPDEIDPYCLARKP